MPAKAYTVEYWGFILFAIGISAAGLIFLYISRMETPDDTTAGGVVTGGEGSICSAPMEVTGDGRLIVRVNGKYPFMVDTAYDYNVVTQEMDAVNKREGRISEYAGHGQTMTVVTTRSTQMPMTILPAGSLSGSGNCRFEASNKTVVSDATPPRLAGILGRAFLEAPGINNVLLDLKNHRIVFNADPYRMGKIVYSTKARDPHFGLYLVDAIVWPLSRRSEKPIRGQFVLDTGARFVIVDQSRNDQVGWEGGYESTLNMSGHVTDTIVHDGMVSIPGTEHASPINISLVQDGASEGSILNRPGGPMGLIGVEAFRNLKILIDSASQTLCVLE